jgi:hypothetical protein
VPPGECIIGSDDAGDLGIERFDMASDLFEALGTVTFEQRDGEVLVPVLQCGAIPHQTVASVDEFASWFCREIRAGPTRGCSAIAIRANRRASIRSALASVPVAWAKRRARSGLSLTQGRAASATSSARWYVPVAS